MQCQYKYCHQEATNSFYINFSTKNIFRRDLSRFSTINLIYPFNNKQYIYDIYNICDFHEMKLRYQYSLISYHNLTKRCHIEILHYPNTSTPTIVTLEY